MSKESEASIMFKTLCTTMDNMSWRYKADQDKLVVYTNAVGKDLTINLIINVDVRRQLMCLRSPLPFKISQDNFPTVAQGVIIANYTMLNGSFELDSEGGYIGFKMVVPFEDCIVGEAVCRYMILTSCKMTDIFNMKLKQLADGQLTLGQFRQYSVEAVK